VSVVQSFWIGPALPTLHQLAIRSFLRHGHSYHLYVYGPLEGVPNGVTLRDASEILPRDSVFCYQHGHGKGSYSAFSNLFRYQLLHERGGWWVDTDLVCLKAFHFDDEYVFATEIDNDLIHQCATCAFKAPAGAPLLKYCIDVVDSKDKMTLQWGEIGPLLLDEAVRRFGLERYRAPVHVFNPINYFEFEQMLAPGFDMTRVARSHGVHLWNQMWKSTATDAEAPAPPDSLYGILREAYAPAHAADSSSR
jgi:hypothetical protein